MFKFVLKNIIAAGVIISLLIAATFLYLKIYTMHNNEIAVPDLEGMSLIEVDSILKERSLNFKVADSLYNLNVPKGHVLEQRPRPEYKLKKNRTIFLTINAYSSEKVIMPNLKNLSIRVAKAILTTKGLKFGKLSFSPDVINFFVKDQKINGESVMEGDTIVKGAVVDLVISKISNEKVPVPDVLEMNLTQAENKLAVSYLNLGALIFDKNIQSEQDSARAKIWKQKPDNESNNVAVGALVDLWLTNDSTKLPGFSPEKSAF